MNTAHPRPWGWRVTTYLWAKGLGGGAMLVAALAVLLGIDLGVLTTIVAPTLGVVGAVVTAGLLIWDLKRPERFYYLLTKSNFGSWLVLGGYALFAFGAVSGIWLLLGIAVEAGLIGSAATVFTILSWLAIPAGAMVAGYTAFLFGQAEGRDLWQSPLLFWHLLAQAVMVGAGALAVAAAIAGTAAAGVALIGGRTDHRHRRAPADAAAGVRRQTCDGRGRLGRTHDHARPVRAGRSGRARWRWPPSPPCGRRRVGRHHGVADRAWPGWPSRSPCWSTSPCSCGPGRTFRCRDTDPPSHQHRRQHPR